MKDIWAILLNDIKEYCEKYHLKYGYITDLGHMVSLEVHYLTQFLFIIVLTDTHVMFSIPKDGNMLYKSINYSEVSNTWMQETITQFPHVMRHIHE
jgi:hypothetical protein